MTMTIKNEDEIRRMDEAGQVVALVHARIERGDRAWGDDGELDDIARETLPKPGAISSFPRVSRLPRFRATSAPPSTTRSCMAFPAIGGCAMATSISVDVGAILAGYHGDSAWTYGGGADLRRGGGTACATPRRRSTWRSTRRRPATGSARSGTRLNRFARERGRGVVREYGGHGIGRQMHEDPHVPNHGDPDRGVVLRSGLTLAIEPMLTLGGEETRTLGDGWTVVTADGSLAAHFEHTVAVGPTGGRVLTRRLAPVLE